MSAFIGETLMRPTPAQASGHPNFVVDVPVQGPTDEGMRAGSCWWAQNVLPKNPSCVDCTGLVPYWTRQKLAPGGPAGPNSGIGDNMEAISFGGVGVHGFALSAAGDPDIWAQLTAAQQGWVFATLGTLNANIVKATGSMCPTWKAPSGASGVVNAAGCFQTWFNATFRGQPVTPLRVDGVFDEATLCGLITTAQIHSADFPTPFPDPAKRYCQTTITPPPAEAKKGLSTGAMAGLAVAGAAAVGGVIYITTRKGGKSRRRR